ncbi:hypothetical protein ANRL4_01164 [Anaerolineae bacterium]|nr:hypothetical protein ANRL4_01164 [Anaerolineae bacterium]
MIISAGRSLWRGISVFERFPGAFVIANIIAGVISLPIITAPIAWGGLSRLAHAAHQGPTCHLDDFWSGCRDYWLHGLLVGVLTAGLMFMLYANYSTYVLQSGALFVLLRAVWFTAAITWLSTLLYLFPLLERMEQPKLTIGLRNALTMTLKNPFFSLVVVIGVALLCVLSSLLIMPWALITFALIASIATAAVQNRLGAYTTKDIQGATA